MIFISFLKFKTILSITIVYLFVAIIFSISISYFQYYYRAKPSKYTILLFSLRSISLFLLLLLFVNPTITTKEVISKKPILNLLVDNSSSIKYFNEDERIKSIINELEENISIKNKFNLQKFKFGTNLQSLDSLKFTENNTNIHKALLNVDNLDLNRQSPIILISDGNQSLGSSYEYFNSKNDIYPVLVGDTTKYVDLKISQLNVNKYSFLDNKFPVEILLNYEGDKKITSLFIIKKNGKTLFREKVTFSKEKSSHTILANLTSNKEGVQYYKASIQNIDSEKNITNNEQTFSINVINEQTKILILTSILHPDIGAFKKAISTNKKNTVDIVTIDQYKNNLNDYQLVILYQPTNKFKNALDAIKKDSQNFLLISGAKTDWNFINTTNLGFKKNAIDQPENYVAAYNSNYLTFYQDDIGFNNFPPLKDKFGKLSINKTYQALLYQTINGFKTDTPLVGTFTEYNQKIGFVFGENIWQWRANSFLATNSFSDFDGFLGNLIQYLASKKKRSRLEVNSETLYNANSTINISAFYTDENYKFDSRASLEITLKNKNDKIKRFPFSLKNSSYQVRIENLEPGEYNYQVQVIGQKISRNGNFRISEYNIEKQFTNANSKNMNQLAKNNNSKLYFKSDIEKLITELLNNDSYITIQKQIAKEKQLLDWKWILFIIITLLAFEWFLRKYLGKI